MTLTSINDWHLGAIRTGGTTPATAYQLRLDLLAGGQRILDGVDGDLLVNGDLFDGPDIPRADILAAIGTFGRWLAKGEGDLWLANGNHDLDKNAQRLSSFQFFAKLLKEQFPGRVHHIETGTAIEKHDAYVIPHIANQDLLNLELARVPACRYLFVHCNYDNQFAVESDHSLNMSKEQAEALPVEYIVFGHEHQGRTELGGKVVIVGNQFPSSVSDCLGGREKYLLQVDNGRYTLHQAWQAEGDYETQDWRELADTGARFIRVIGQAAAAEAAAVVTAISRFRNVSKALVITNAVKVEGVNDSEQFELTHEQVTSFNVRDALREYLTDEENEKIDKLRETENA